MDNSSNNSASMKQQEDIHNLLNAVVNGVLTNIVVVLGLIGNLLTIIILSQRAMRSSTNYYLSALAIWDSVVLICTLLLIGLRPLPNMDGFEHNVHPYIVSYVYPLALIAQTATIWLTVSFTVERYIAVCHPLKAASMCTISRAKIVIMGVSLGSAIYNIPRWFEFRPRVVEIESPDPNTTELMTIVIRTKFSQNAVYLEVYFSWLYVPIMCIVPLLVLSILNTFLILAVRRSKRQRKDMNVRQSRENNVTIMLVTVIFVFIICQVPALVYNLAYAINMKHVTTDFGYHVLSIFRNFLVSLNSAINFILYCALGQKFRRIFIHTFFRKCVHENYIPMSGVHNHTTTVTSLPNQKRFCPSRIHLNQSKCLGPASGQHSSSTTYTSSTPQSSVDNTTRAKALNYAPYRHQNFHNRAWHEKQKTNTPRPHDIETDNEVPYDVAMQHLLPDRDHPGCPVYKMEMGSMNKTLSP